MAQNPKNRNTVRLSNNIPIRVKDLKAGMMSVASVHNLEKQKVKKYNTCYSHLSNLILNMTEEQQSLLLEQAHQIINENKKSALLNVILDKNWIFISGFILGWFITSLFFIIFTIS